jgi:hydrogenase expression/formation protein HypD
MSLLDSYVNKDVLKHFTGLINDLATEYFEIYVLSNELLETIDKYNFKSLLSDNIKFVNTSEIDGNIGENTFIDNLIKFSTGEKSITVVKKEWLNKKGSRSTLNDELKKGFDIRVVEDILAAMVVASRKRRNKVVYATGGFEDEALITAAGLAKAKTVGFRNFFVYQNHLSSPNIVKTLAEKNIERNCGFLLPLKTGLNTGAGKFSEIPLVYNKSVVFSGYEAMEIMQSVFMLVDNFFNDKNSVKFQRTKELSDEIVMRSIWMIEEVFMEDDCYFKNFGFVKSGKLKINDKYKMFDAELTVIDN